MPATPASSFGLPNNGFVPVATISPASTVADPAHNAELCYEGLQRAATLGAKVVAFPEVVLTSYIADQLIYPVLNRAVVQAQLRLFWMPVVVPAVVICSLVLAQLVDWAAQALMGLAALKKECGDEGGRRYG